MILHSCMHVCIYGVMHAYMHTYMHACMHAYILSGAAFIEYPCRMQHYILTQCMGRLGYVKMQHALLQGSQ
jgi:hypothetical protein